MFLTCKHVLPHMERQGGGAIINVSSVAAERASAPYPLLAYSASKGGVNALTRSMAMQYAAKGIRVNAIMPGLIRTPMAVDQPARQYGLDREAFIRMRDEAVPMKRMGEAWDVAWAAAFLASDEARIHYRRRAPRGWRAFLQGLGRSPFILLRRSRRRAAVCPRTSATSRGAA